MTLMEESALPAIYIKKELKRTAAEANLDKLKRKEVEGYPATPGGSHVPPSIFDCKYPIPTKIRKRPPLGGINYPGGPPGFPTHPIPRPQLEV